MANRFIIGRGEVLTYEIPPPKSGGPKVHPYSLVEAKVELIPQIQGMAAQVRDLPALACPSGLAVAKMTLHPAYIAKSFFPTGLLRGAGLISVGSRTVRVAPRKDTRKKIVEQRETTQIFVAGTLESFARFPAYAQQLEVGIKEGVEFSEIEALGLMSSADRIKASKSKDGQGVYEVGLHLIPDTPAEVLRRSFTAYCRQCGFTVASKYEFQVGGLVFVPVEGNASGLDALAQFTLMRVIRPMPMLRSVRPLTRGAPISVGFKLPVSQPLSNEPSVAVLDGGLPPQHVLSPIWATISNRMMRQRMLRAIWTMALASHRPFCLGRSNPAKKRSVHIPTLTITGFWINSPMEKTPTSSTARWDMWKKFCCLANTSS